MAFLSELTQPNEHLPSSPSRHRAPAIEVPLQNEPSVAEHMHVLGRMVTQPRHEHEVAASDPGHLNMVPQEGTCCSGGLGPASSLVRRRARGVPCPSSAIASGADERIARAEGREAGEVAVGGQDLVDAVVAADRGDARVVDLRASDVAGANQPAERRPVCGRLGEQDERRRLEPAVRVAPAITNTRWLLRTA